MSEPEDIFARAQQLLERRADLAGKRVVVSAGGTREPLDAVRYVGNRSSGRMGVALAAEARRRGADVTLLAANLAVPPPVGVEVVQTPTAADLEREALARADGADLVLMAAAVSDYRPADPDDAKRPKDDEPWQVTLEPTTDVLRDPRRARGRTARCWSGLPPSTAETVSPVPARSSGARRSTWSSGTTSPATTSASTARRTR